MTDLTRSVTRRTALLVDGRRLYVTLTPTGNIEFRPEHARKRSVLSASLEDVLKFIEEKNARPEPEDVVR